VKRPTIGINCKLVSDTGDSYLKLDRNYMRSVERAGGDPLLLPFLSTPADARRFFDRIDGVVFTGGPDVNPCRWREPQHPKADLMHPDREASDFLALREALRRDLPALCICCGHQELNVALGGSLDQHIYDRPGVKGHSEGATHAVALTAKTRTRAIIGVAEPIVNSWHHQAIRDVGHGLVVTAISPDGVIEGVESPERRFLIGVQWHPERMQEDARQQALFRALVSEARKPATSSGIRRSPR
jgi:putative glutamine amidotransferase